MSAPPSITGNPWRSLSRAARARALVNPVSPKTLIPTMSGWYASASSRAPPKMARADSPSRDPRPSMKGTRVSSRQVRRQKKSWSNSLAAVM